LGITIGKSLLKFGYNPKFGNISNNQMSILYTVVSKMTEIQQRLDLDIDVCKLPNYLNPVIRVGEITPVIVSSKRKHVSMLRYGMPDRGRIISDLRSEGDRNLADDWNYRGVMGIVNGKYRQKILHQRCAVVCDAYIGGEKDGKAHLIYPRDKKRPFLIAGIHDNESFAILTIFGNPLSKILGESRTPAILTGRDISHWLNDKNISLGVGMHLKPLNPAFFNAYPISNAVFSSAEKNIKLLNPVGPKIYEEPDQRRLRERAEWRARKEQKEIEQAKEDSLSYIKRLQILRDRGLIP
jgi:putative SOS response-associated peptidase YedK